MILDDIKFINHGVNGIEHVIIPLKEDIMRYNSNGLDKALLFVVVVSILLLC